MAWNISIIFRLFVSDGDDAEECEEEEEDDDEA